jgi:rubredoxin
MIQRRETLKTVLNQVHPGEDIPADGVCPTCGAEKKRFLAM